MKKCIHGPGESPSICIYTRVNNPYQVVNCLSERADEIVDFWIDTDYFFAYTESER